MCLISGSLIEAGFDRDTFAGCVVTSHPCMVFIQCSRTPTTLAVVVQLVQDSGRCSCRSRSEPCYRSTINFVWDDVPNVPDAWTVFHLRGLDTILAVCRVQRRGDLGIFRPAFLFLATQSISTVKTTGSVFSPFNHCAIVYIIDYAVSCTAAPLEFCVDTTVSNRH